MGIYTFLTKEDKERMTSSTNHNVNNALQRLRELSDNFYLQTTKVKSRIGFGAWKYKDQYSLYFDDGKGGFSAMYIFSNLSENEASMYMSAFREGYMNHEFLKEGGKK